MRQPQAMRWRVGWSRQEDSCSGYGMCIRRYAFLISPMLRPLTASRRPLAIGGRVVAESLNERGGEGGVRLPLLAPLRHTGGPTTCLLIGVDRTWPAPGQNDANDPKPDIALF